MKTRIFLFVLLLVTTATNFGQTPTKQASQAKTGEEEVRQLEFAIVRALFPFPRIGSFPKRFIAADLNTALGDEYMRVGAGGEQITKPQEIERAKTATLSFNASVIEDELLIRIYGETAVATSRVTVKERKREGEVEEQYRVTNVYVWRANRWQQVSSQWTAARS